MSPLMGGIVGIVLGVLFSRLVITNDWEPIWFGMAMTSFGWLILVAMGVLE